MGAWGHQPFDNDDANDWLDGARSPAAIDAAFASVIGKREIDAVAGTFAVAAAAVVAVAIDGEAADLPESVPALAKRVRVDARLRTRALAALDVVAGEGSELRALWNESAHAEPWRESIAALRRRIGG